MLEGELNKRAVWIIDGDMEGTEEPIEGLEDRSFQMVRLSDIQEAKKAYISRKYHINPKKITPEFLAALRERAKILREIEKKDRYVGNSDLLWFFDWFGDSL